MVLRIDKNQAPKLNHLDHDWLICNFLLATMLFALLLEEIDYQLFLGSSDHKYDLEIEDYLKTQNVLNAHHT